MLRNSLYTLLDVVANTSLSDFYLRSYIERNRDQNFH